MLENGYKIKSFFQEEQDDPKWKERIERIIGSTEYIAGLFIEEVCGKDECECECPLSLPETEDTYVVYGLTAQAQEKYFNGPFGKIYRYNWKKYLDNAGIIPQSSVFNGICSDKNSDGICDSFWKKDSIVNQFINQLNPAFLPGVVTEFENLRCKDGVSLPYLIYKHLEIFLPNLNTEERIRRSISEAGYTNILSWLDFHDQECPRNSIKQLVKNFLIETSDHDGDEENTIFEIMNGSDPTDPNSLADANGDNVPDWMMYDADQDGWPNGYEYEKYGGNANLPESIEAVFDSDIHPAGQYTPDLCP